MKFYVRVSDVDYRVGGPYENHAEAEARCRHLARELSSQIWIETEEGEEVRPISEKAREAVEFWLNNDASAAFRLQVEEEMASLEDVMEQIMTDTPASTCQTLWFDRRKQEAPDSWRWIGIDQFGREVAGSLHERGIPNP